MARTAEPHEQWYGDAVILSHYDHLTGRTRVTVERADDRIGVNFDLWTEMQPPHRVDDQTLVLDTAGEYRYQLVEPHPTQNVLIFERIRDDEPSSGGER